MRKVVIVAHIDDPYSGGGVCLINQCKALGSEKVRAVVLFRDCPLRKVLSSLGIKVILCPNVTLNIKCLFDSFKNFIDTFPPNKTIIHTHTERTSVCLNPVFWLLRYTVVTTVHRSLLSGSPWGGVKGKIFLFLENLVLRRFTSLVATVSKSLMIELINQRKIPESRIVTVHNCVAQSQFVPKEKKRKKSEIIILSILRFAPEKGFMFFVSDPFLKLCDEIGRPIRLVLLGDGPYREYFESLAKIAYNERPIELVLMGTVQNVHEYLENSDLYFQPSKSEAFCLAAVEASLYSLPIFTSSLPVFDEVFQEYSGHFKLPILGEDLAIEDVARNVNLALKGPRFGKKFVWREYPFSLSKHKENLDSMYKLLEKI